MARLRYLFWAMALFMVSGCGAKTVMVYRWDVLRTEMPTAQSGRKIFGEPNMAAGNIYGDDQIAGVNLNRRNQPHAATWVTDRGGAVEYSIHDNEGFYVSRRPFYWGFGAWPWEW